MGLILLSLVLAGFQSGCANYAAVSEKRPGFHPIHATAGVLASAEEGISRALLLTRSSPEKALAGFLESAAAAQQQLLMNPGDVAARHDYNFAVARVFTVLRNSTLDPWTKPLVIPSDGGEFILTHRPDAQKRASWNPSRYDLTPADEFEIKGTYVTEERKKEGVGAPLVAVGKETNADARQNYFVARTYYGVTAVAHFNGRRCEISFEDPLSTETVRLKGKSFPLAADYTVPMAVMLASTKPKKMELSRLLHPGKYADTAGISRLQPYDPNKTVVLVVHGLKDSPATWTPMLNTLRADENIRKNYQFWFYSYPSGYPYPYSAAIMRKELDGIQKRYPLQKKMVVVGHSMGGCISRLLITDSGMTLWNTFFPKPPDQMNMSADSREFYEKSLIFQHRPEVGRVIFISAPLQGADLAGGWVGRLGARLVRAPSNLVAIGRDSLNMVTLQPGASPAKRMPNSVDTLSPNNRFVKAEATLPFAPGIPYHSIMGDRGKGGNKDHTKPVHSDGLVPYWSSHLDGAQSELVVPSDHSAHQDPQAIAEVLRILKASAGG